MASETVCPLCGQANGCAMAEDPLGRQSCWCMSTAFTEMARQRLRSLDGQVCICARCASQAGDSAALTSGDISDMMPPIH